MKTATPTTTALRRHLHDNIADSINRPTDKRAVITRTFTSSSQGRERWHDPLGVLTDAALRDASGLEQLFQSLLRGR